MSNTAELLSQIISADTLSELGKASGASKSEVKSVLTAAVPVLLQGMQNNAGTKSGEASLTKAISDHAADDTSDIAAFFQKADAEDGKKILAHVLGGENDEIQKAVAKKTGVSKSKTGTILALAAPLLLSLLGKTNDNENASGITSLLSLLENRRFRQRRRQRFRSRRRAAEHPARRFLLRKRLLRHGADRFSARRDLGRWFRLFLRQRHGACWRTARRR